MASINTVLLMGNLTRDPELRYTSSGAAVCNVGLAMNSRFTTAQGEVREEVCFVDIEVWGKQAESLQRYKRKGETVFVEGRLKLDSWQDRDTNQKRSRLSVRADRIQFIGFGNRDEMNQGGGQADYQPQQQPYGNPQGQGGYGGGYSQPQQPQQQAPAFGQPQQQGGFQQPQGPQRGASMPAPPSFNAPANPAPNGGDDFKGGPKPPIFETIDEPEDDIPF